MACRSCGKDSIQVGGGFHVVWNACTIYERLVRTLQFVIAFAHTKDYIPDAIYLVVECINDSQPLKYKSEQKIEMATCQSMRKSLAATTFNRNLASKLSNYRQRTLTVQVRN